MIISSWCKVDYVVIQDKEIDVFQHSVIYGNILKPDAYTYAWCLFIAICYFAYV